MVVLCSSVPRWEAPCRPLAAWCVWPCAPKLSFSPSYSATINLFSACFLPGALLFFFLARLSSLSFYLGLFCSLFLGFYLDTLVNDFPLFLFSNICIFTTLLRYNLYIVHLFEVYSSFSIFRIMQPSSPST